MEAAEHELRRMLARTTIGNDLAAIEVALRRLVKEDLFTSLDEPARRRLERLTAEAGGRALYAFLAPWLEAIGTFTNEHPGAVLQQDDRPVPVTPPRLGEWVREPASRSAPGVRSWHLFTGDFRMKVARRAATTYAEARCGRLLAVSDDDARVLERADERPMAGACRTCRGIGARPRYPTRAT
jgi:hypothetical protein